MRYVCMKIWSTIWVCSHQKTNFMNMGWGDGLDIGCSVSLSALTSLQTWGFGLHYGGLSWRRTVRFKDEKHNGIAMGCTVTILNSYLRWHEGHTYTVELIRDGGQSASIIRNVTVPIWAKMSCYQCYALREHENWDHSLVQSSNGGQFNLKSHDLTGQIWDAK